MTKKALDEKYAYQIEEHNIVHLFRGEDDCQQYLTNPLLSAIFKIETLEKEITELRKVAEFQQSSNMSRHFENKKLKEGLAVGSTFNKALNSMNKNLEEERDKYRNMVFDKDEELTKAKEHIRTLISCLIDWVQEGDKDYCHIVEAEQFLKETEE